MANRKKGRRTIVVGDHSYQWHVYDNSQGEGFWTLQITAEHDWQKQIEYPLTETGLVMELESERGIPMVDEFDLESRTLKNYVTTEIGIDRHIPASPRLVRWLIEWYSENEWNTG